MITTKHLILLGLFTEKQTVGFIKRAHGADSPSHHCFQLWASGAQDVVEAVTPAVGTGTQLLHRNLSIAALWGCFPRYREEQSLTLLLLLTLACSASGSKIQLWASEALKYSRLQRYKAVSLCTVKLLVVAILGQCLHGELFWNVYTVF